MRQQIFSKAVLGASLAASLMLMPVDAHAQRRTPPHTSGGHVSGGGGGHVVAGGPVYRPVYRGSYYRPYYYGSYYYRPYFYDPFFWGAYGWGYGWGVGLGYGYGWGWYPYGGYAWGPYGGYPYGPYGYYGGRYSDARIEVNPREAKVYVDGYYAGVVDDFDGWAQRLDVPPGQHEIEIYLPGYRTMKEQFLFQPGHTIKMKGSLEKMPPGVQPDPEPQPQAPPPGQQRQQYQQPPNGQQPPYGADDPQQSAAPQPNPYNRPPHRAPQNTVRATDPSQFGTLSIRVQPQDAAIYVDGERWETGESQRGFSIQMAPGRHRVEVKKDGFRTFSADVQVESGELTPLNVSLLAAHEIEQ